MTPFPGQQPANLKFRLSVMMFLQYAIWGAWLPLMYQFLSAHRGFADGEIGYLFMIGGVGAVIAPFIAGQVADRCFNTERYLALSHTLGGVLVWQLSWIEDYWMFFLFSLLYSLIYSPTLALTNSLSFHHLPDRDRDFGKVRLWGTVGWICVGIGIGQWLLHTHTPADGGEAQRLAMQASGIRDAFRLSAILGVVMGVYCLTLPATPPARGRQNYAAAEAIAEARRQPLLTLFLIAVPISCIHQFYFVHTSAFLNTYQARIGGVADAINQVFGVGGGGLMTIGQMSEIIVLALIPLVARKISRKNLLALGIVAYALRMFLFAYVDSIGLPPMITLIGGVALHGVCFGCFVFVAFMVVDEQTTPDVRASAQSLFGLVIFGVGIIVGSIVAGYVGDWAKSSGAMDYQRLFSVPMWAAIVCLALMLALYPAGRRMKDEDSMAREM
jgi:nucleoside transporter